MIEKYQEQVSSPVKDSFGFMLRFAQSDLGRWGPWHALIEDDNVGFVEPWLDDGHELTECEKAFDELIRQATEDDQELLLDAMDEVNEYWKADEEKQGGEWVTFKGRAGYGLWDDDDIMVNTKTGATAHRDYLRSKGIL